MIRALSAATCVLVLCACPAKNAGTADSGMSADDGGASTHDAGVIDAGPPLKILEQSFGAFTTFASPIDDYLEVANQSYPNGQYNKAITELMPFDGKLFFGYGDGTVNLGTVMPIEMRWFSAPTDPKWTAAPIAGMGQGAAQISPYQSGEEQIDRYRICNGELWQAGLDSTDADELWTQMNTTPKAIAGNAYRYDMGTFVKLRTIVGGEHVQDVAGFKGNIFAVGSGADTRMEFEAGKIFRYLWMSTDRGATFTTALRVLHPQPGSGDTRWAHLLPTSNKLFLYGYITNAQGNAFISNAVLEDMTITELKDTELMGQMFPSGTLSFPDGSGVVYGADLSAGGVRTSVFSVASDGTAAVLESFRGMTVLDTSLSAETNEVVYLAAPYDDYLQPAPASFEVKVLVAQVATPGQFTEVAKLSVTSPPQAVAYWKGHLFIGTADSKVMRSTGTLK